MDTKKSIVIVGGGFAGTTLARALDQRLPAGYELLLISEESYTTFTPMLPEALGASIFPEQVVAPIRLMLTNSRFVMGALLSINRETKTFTASSLAGNITMPYEHLILAFGNRARLDLIQGAAEHAMPLKTIGDAMHIRNMVLRRIAQMELETDPVVKKRLGHFVVIGGGFSGVETAGELVDCLRSIQRYYKLVDPAHLKVTVLQAMDRLLAELSISLGKSALCSLVARGVDVRLNTSAVLVTADEVQLTDGEKISTATVISTIGTRPNAIIEEIGLPTNYGRIVANDDMSVAGSPGIWAIGDCAEIMNAYDNKSAPPTAQFAVREARCLAKNIMAVIDGRDTIPFRHRSLGAMAAIGYRKGVAEVFGIPISGLPAWFLWRAYYLSQVPTLGRKIRIFVEWTWGMFFPNDITHLRFQRSKDIGKN